MTFPQYRIHNIMKHFFPFGLMMATFLLSMPAEAQVKEARFGHIDTQTLLEAMPERNSIQSEIEGAAAQYEQEIVRMQGELEGKVAEYQQKAESWPAAIRAQKEQEITMGLADWELRTMPDRRMDEWTPRSRKFFTLRASRRGGDRESFRENLSKSFHLANFSDAPDA